MKKIILLVLLALAVPLSTVFAADNYEAETRAYIQSGLNNNRMREATTGIERSEHDEVAVDSLAKEYYYSTLGDAIQKGDDEAIDVQALFTVTLQNGSFKAKNAPELNQYYRAVTNGGDGARLQQQTFSGWVANEYLGASVLAKTGLSLVMALLTEASSYSF